MLCGVLQTGSHTLLMIESNDFWVELKSTTSEKGTTSLQRTRVVLPTCPLFRGSTVH